MLHISSTEVFGFKAALRDMRNPMESWDKSDSRFRIDCSQDPYYIVSDPARVRHFQWRRFGFSVPEFPVIGPNDLKLAGRLIGGGTEHRKFLRQIVINTVIEAPRYVWQELDTYKVATVRNSCSTMHKLGHRDLTPDDFIDQDVSHAVLEDLNTLGRYYREGGMKDYDLVIKMKRRLPEGYLQRAGYHMSYETALSMFRQRRNHRLPEWRYTLARENTIIEVGPLHWQGSCWEAGPQSMADGKISICDWIHLLPYMSEFIAAMDNPG